MSLDFKLDKIKNYETVTRDGKKLNIVTEGLIWSTLGIGLGRITEKNIDEWLMRLAFVDRLNGSTMLFKGSGPEREPRPFTREELVAHIGLTTNVSDEPRLRWSKRIMDGFFRDRAWEIKREITPTKVA